MGALLHELTTAQFYVRLGQIMGIDLLLSGDNAVVIALASRTLPEAQRRIAVVGGAFGAIALRVLFTLVIVWIMQVPYLKLIGGLLLLYIAVKLVLPEGGGDGENIAAGTTVRAAIQTIVLADAVMSLDNVVAIAAAAGGSTILIVLGLLISMPLIIFGSQLVLRLLGRYPILVFLGAGLLGWVAGEIIIGDPAVHTRLPYDAHTQALIAKPILALAVMATGALLARRARQRGEGVDLLEGRPS